MCPRYRSGYIHRGATLDELYKNIKEAVALHFEELHEPITILTISEMKLTDAEIAAGK